jgi:hypothetical protein
VEADRPGGEADPFAASFDESFVRRASVREPSAADRERQARILRDHEGLRARAHEERRAFREAGRQSPWGRRFKAAVAIAAVVAIAAWIGLTPHPHGQFALSYGSDLSGASVEVVAHPHAGVGEEASPLGRPAPAPSGTGPYKFMVTQPGSSAPVAYDPCRLIHVVLNDRTAPPGADVLVRSAIERASQVSGLQFVIDGSTDERPSAKRAAYQPTRYPGRWAPVLIAWSDPAETPRLAGDIAGLGGSVPFTVDGRRVYVSGGVTLDGPDLYEVMGRANGQELVRAVIEHELGHLLGLDHVADASQLMNAGNEGLLDYAAGDQLGLEALGRGRCFPGV